MGALHAGHTALVDAAQSAAERTIVSIFVNPTQFGPAEDFGGYPRDEAQDLRMLSEAGVDAAFIPLYDAMYPKGDATTVNVAGVTDGLESATRPQFFTGVATVVTKLLLQCLADAAVFGEKDYQQLLAVRRLVRDLAIPTEILSVPTVREADGLACSSRNVYLSPEERQIAAELIKVLLAMADRLKRGASPMDQADWGMAELRSAGFTQVDYVAVCDAETLMPVGNLERPARILAAVRLGGTRLIDTVAV